MIENLEKRKVSLKNIFMRFASVVDKGDNPKADILMFKEKPEEVIDDKSKGGNVMTKTFEEIVKALPEDEQVVITAEIEKVKEEAKPRDEKKPEGVASFDEAEVVKSADPKVQELIAKQKEDLEKAQRESEADKAEIKKFQDDLKKERIEKTVATFDRIAVPKEEMVTLFTKLDNESAAIVEKVMKAVNEQLTAANIVKVIGTDAEGEQLTAEATIEKEAKELMSKNTSLTLEGAKVKVIKTKPELYKQYEEEKKGV
jgi:hypothetical protein